MRFVHMPVQIATTLFFGSYMTIQWFQLTVALFSLHIMSVVDDAWEEKHADGSSSMPAPSRRKAGKRRR